jgi:hypothetical protein
VVQLGAGIVINSMKAQSLLIGIVACARLVADSGTPMTRIPVDLNGVTVTVETPKKWAESEFGYRTVPPDVKSQMGRSGEFVICSKSLEWSRGFLRGQLGHIYLDVVLRVPALFDGYSSAEGEKKREHQARLQRIDFRRPLELAAYLSNSRAAAHGGDHYQVTCVSHKGHIWVRIRRVDKTWNGISVSEDWFIGVDRDAYVRIDFAASKDSEGPKAEAWQKSALYWQNKMIESLTVTGLEQDLTGVENVETWRFPEALEYSPDLAK